MYNPVEGKKKATLRVEDIFSDEDEEMIEAPAPVEEMKEATPEPIEQEQEEQKEEEQKDQEEEKGDIDAVYIVKIPIIDHFM